MKTIFVRLMDGRKVNVKKINKDNNNFKEWRVIVVDDEQKQEIIDISQIHTIGGT